MRILVADDEPSIRRALDRVLTDEGHDVMAAPDGESAIRLLERGERFDLLILDYMMPGVSGAVVGMRARELRSDQAVIFSSGYVYADESIAAAVPGARHLPKPIDPGELLDLIKELIP